MGIFDNPYYREQLFMLGLRPETAYGCAYDFLLYPQPQVRIFRPQTARRTPLAPRLSRVEGAPDGIGFCAPCAPDAGHGNSGFEALC